MTVSVFKIEYEIEPSMSNWTAFVGAFTHEEAIRHVETKVKKRLRITSSGLYCRLDDISSAVRNTVTSQAIAALGVKSEESRLEEEAMREKKRKIVKE